MQNEMFLVNKQLVSILPFLCPLVKGNCWHTYVDG